MSPAAALALTCPKCGAPSHSGASRCAYCRTRLATVSCPSCFGLLFEGAAFCGHCGAARSRSQAPAEKAIACPACREAMTWTRVGEVDLLECGSCEAIWVEAATFERICADRESQAAVLHTSRDPAPVAARAERIRYRPCPRCGRMMNRVNFGRTSGAVVDVCKGHGTFLDRGELHEIVRFIQTGGIDRTRAAEREQLVEEQRRLRDLQREQARLAPSSSPSTWTDGTMQDLLSALFER